MKKPKACGGGKTMHHFSYQYIQNLQKVLDGFPHALFEKLIQIMLTAYDEGRHIFVMGNGGSASTASHWVCDINKGCCMDYDKKFKMICLNDSISTMLAYANDFSYEDIFVEQLRNFFMPGDVVIGISGSGNSANVLKAITYANAHGGITVGLCGFDGGKLYALAHITLLARAEDMQQIEDVHMVVAHMAMQRLCQELKSRIVKKSLERYPQELAVSQAN
jgi:D-sedoheptulose 7-phosphate isomerase